MRFNPSLTDLCFDELSSVFSGMDAEIDAATHPEQMEVETHWEQSAQSDNELISGPGEAIWPAVGLLNSDPDRATSRIVVHQPEELPLEDTYLKFRLEPDIPAAVSVRSVQEAFILPSRQLTAMPNMPAALLGLTNRRNQVVWVIDLAQLLGLSVFDATVQQFSLLLLQVGMVKIGLAVQQIEGMVRLGPDAIQAPIGQTSVALLPYLQGCALQQQEGRQEILLLLDAEAIVQSRLMKYPFA
jgi:positive phototaxis protein PixI